MVILSFLDYSLAIPEKNGYYIGFHNYISILNNPAFHKAIKVSTIYIFSTLIIESLFGLLIAIFLFENLKNRILIPIISIPLMVAPITVGLIWLLLFQGEYGLFDFLLKKLGILENYSILSNSSTALLAIIIVDIWQWTPFFTLLFYAGLISIPNEQIESAKIDGASKFRLFMDIQIPTILPIIVVTLLIRFIEAFKEFDKVFILTGGGPGNETELFSLLGWRINFRNWDIGLGASYVTILYLAISLIIYLFLKFSKINEEAE